MEHVDFPLPRWQREPVVVAEVFALVKIQGLLAISSINLSNVWAIAQKWLRTKFCRHCSIPNDDVGSQIEQKDQESIVLSIYF